jgi:hypothetical protein
VYQGHGPLLSEDIHHERGDALKKRVNIDVLQ